MGFLVLLIVIGLPVVEIWLMIEIGDEIGALPTVALILATAALGALLFRIQGVATLERVKAHLERDEMPVGELLSGLGLLIAGFLLLIPGFLTDALGLLLFVPSLRRLLIGATLAWAATRRGTRIWKVRGSPGGPSGPRPSRQGPVIDGDFRDVSGTGPGEAPSDDRTKRLPDEER
jgi:UPF0716 protein FxsA